MLTDEQIKKLPSYRVRDDVEGVTMVYYCGHTEGQMIQAGELIHVDPNDQAGNALIKRFTDGEKVVKKKKKKKSSTTQEG